MIPKIIHHIWVGDKPLPEEESCWMETWRDRHPSWEFKFWTNNNLPELPDNCSRALEKYNRFPAFQADIIRYVAVLKYGGLYVDTDMECVKSVDSLLEGVGFVGLNPSKKAYWICNGFFAATPQHKILQTAVDSIYPTDVVKPDGREASAKQIDRDYRLHHFGPIYLTKNLIKYTGSQTLDVRRMPPQNDIRILGPEYWWQDSGLCHLLHYARASWLKAEP
tara:strand:+ start:663 stop:1325 length:663 start_codon:yes stop_codon:yes gene_type:complete